MDLINRKSLIDKLDPWYKKIKKTAPDNLAEGFMQVDGLIRHEPSAFDGMTNGEVIQALFPNETTFDETATCTYYGNMMRFYTKWWNAPYKAESEDEK
jgi:hypothetical protein